MFAIQPRLLLPLMIFTGVLMVGVRTNDIWAALTEDKPFSSVTQAVAASDKKAEETKPAATVDAAKTAEAPKEAAKKGDEKSERQPPKESSTPESDLYKQLAGRRDQLDKRAQELDEREALVVVTEKRIEQKIKEMETLRGQLQSLLGQASEAQQAQLENLVKIYEIMKPKEAAKIFEALEMPVLLGVVQKMKPARTAAVMAEMNPDKAKEITIALTKRDQLPQVK